MAHNVKTTTDYLQHMLAGIGLTPNDSRVYITLHQAGVPLLGAKVAHLSSVQRQYAYRSLKKLCQMGLVLEQIRGSRVYFAAYPPSTIVKTTQKKLFEAEEIAHALEKISRVDAEQDFEIYSGDREVIAYERNIVKTIPLNTTQYIIGGDSDSFMQYFSDVWDELTLHGGNRGLVSYYIASPEEMPWPEKARQTQRAFHYRVLDTLPRTLVSNVVRFDTVAMYSMATPPLIYVIKSKRIAEDYKKQFDMLWNMAREPREEEIQRATE